MLPFLLDLSASLGFRVDCIAACGSLVPQAMCQESTEFACIIIACGASKASFL